MGAITTILLTAAVAAGTVSSVHSTNMQEKSTKSAREGAEKQAEQARQKLASDEAAALELATAQVEARRRAIARNKALQTNPLETEESGSQRKTVLGQ